MIPAAPPTGPSAAERATLLAGLKSLAAQADGAGLADLLGAVDGLRQTIAIRAAMAGEVVGVVKRLRPDAEGAAAGAMEEATSDWMEDLL